MIHEPRVAGLGNFRPLRFPGIRRPPERFASSLDSQMCRGKPPLGQPAFERAARQPPGRNHGRQAFPKVFAAAEKAQNDIAMPIEHFRQALHDQVRAQLQRPAQRWARRTCCRSIAGCSSDARSRRMPPRRRLLTADWRSSRPAPASCWAESPPPRPPDRTYRRRSTSIPSRRASPPQQRKRFAIHPAADDRMIACLELREQRRRQGRHARGRDRPAIGRMQELQFFRQEPGIRMAVALIDIAWLAARQAVHRPAAGCHIPRRSPDRWAARAAASAAVAAAAASDIDRRDWA